MTKFQEMVQVAIDALQAKNDRDRAAEKFAEGALTAFVKYAAVPDSYLEVLEWDGKQETFVRSTRKLSWPSCVHYVEAEDVWSFRFYLRLTDNLAMTQLGASVVSLIAEHGGGYNVGVQGFEPFYVDLNVQSQRERLFATWVEAVKAEFVKPEPDDDEDDTVDTKDVDHIDGGAY